MSIEFYNTGYGRALFENQIPNLIKSLNRVADSLERIEETNLKSDSPIHPHTNTYVLYQENSKELQIESIGAVSDMILAKSLDEVKAIVYEWLYRAQIDGYLPIHSEDIAEFIKEITNSGESVLWLYHKGDEDSPLYYSITVKSFGVTEKSNNDIKVKGFSPIISKETSERLRDVMENDEKSERLADIFYEQYMSDDESFRKKRTLSC